MKLIKYIVPASLIILGAGAEIYFYGFRFISDGMNLPVSIAIGTALTVMLAISSTFKNKSLAVALIIYSVVATSAGQSYSLELVRQEEQIIQQANEQNRREYDRLQSNIDALTTEWQRLDSEKSGLELRDYSLWRTALANLNERQSAVADDIKAFSDEQAQLSQSVLIQPEDIYSYYSRLLGVNADLFQFILQSALSVFVALMAPVGIAIWPKAQESAVITESKHRFEIKRDRFLSFIKDFTKDSTIPLWADSGLNKDEYRAATIKLKQINALKGDRITMSGDEITRSV